MKQLIATMELVQLIAAVDASDAGHYAMYHPAILEGRPRMEVEVIEIAVKRHGQDDLAKMLWDLSIPGMHGSTMFQVKLFVNFYVELPDGPASNDPGVDIESSVPLAGTNQDQGSGDTEF